MVLFPTSEEFFLKGVSGNFEPRNRSKEERNFYLRKMKYVGSSLGNKRNIRELVGYFVI